MTLRWCLSCSLPSLCARKALPARPFMSRVPSQIKQIMQSQTQKWPPLRNIWIFKYFGGWISTPLAESSVVFSGGPFNYPHSHTVGIYTRIFEMVKGINILKISVLFDWIIRTANRILTIMMMMMMMMMKSALRYCFQLKCTYEQLHIYIFIWINFQNIWENKIKSKGL